MMSCYTEEYFRVTLFTLPSFVLRNFFQTCRFISITMLNKNEKEVFNPFFVTSLFLSTLKTFSDVFSGYRKRSLAWDELNALSKAVYCK